jgi:hypothetical protein
MDANTKKDGSAGRARGHSMLSALKIIGNVQVHEEESQQDHPGISFQRLRQGLGGAAGIRPSMASTAGRVVSATHVSSLTMALKAAGQCFRLRRLVILLIRSQALVRLQVPRPSRSRPLTPSLAMPRRLDFHPTKMMIARMRKCPSLWLSTRSGAAASPPGSPI